MQSRIIYIKKTISAHWLLIFVCFLFLGIVFFGILFKQKTTPIRAAGPNDWNQVQKDPQRSGYTAEIIGTTIQVKWRYAFAPERVHPQVQAIVYDDGTGAKVFVGTEMGNMNAIDAANGTKKWSATIGSPILNSVAADNGKVYFGAMDGAVYALNTSDGTQAWKTQASKKGFSTAPILADGKVMLGGRDGKFYAFDAASGNKIWEYDAGSPILQTAAWNGGKAFFGTMDMYVHAVNTTNGAQVWKSAKTKGIAFKDYWPVVTQGKVIIIPITNNYNAGIEPAFPFGFYGATDTKAWNWLKLNSAALAAGNATAVTDFMTAQEQVMADYKVNPANYTPTVYVLDEANGQFLSSIPHHDVQHHNGATSPPCIDVTGKLVTPTLIIGSSWGRVDYSFATGPRIVDLLYDGTDYAGNPLTFAGGENVAGFGNIDENLNVSCTANAILSFHTQEMNANFTGIFYLGTHKWQQVAKGWTNGEMFNSSESQGGNPVSVSNGIIYHISFSELIARSTGAPTPTPTPAATATPTTTPTPTPGTGTSLGDVTASLTNLGNPSKARYPLDNDADEYARNVWDLQVFNGRVYIGSGNSSNFAPRSNAGPVDLWYYDLTASVFAKDTIASANCGTDCIDEEQLDTFRIIDSTLYTAGHDPKNNAAGDFYRIEGGSWKAYHNTPLELHGYDVYKFNNKLFLVGASGNALNAAISYSDDSGTTWKPANCQTEGSKTTFACWPTGRAYSMFEMDGKLYVSWPNTPIPGTSLLEYDAVNNVFVILSWDKAAAMFPTLPACATGGIDPCPQRSSARVARAVQFNGQTVGIASATTNDHQWEAHPEALTKAASLTTAQKITLSAPAGWKPQDLLVNGSNIYVLVKSASKGTYTNYVFVSSDLTTWTEVLRFTHETFARSFEYANGNFYFGMGAETTTPIPNTTGDILRVKYP